MVQNIPGLTYSPAGFLHLSDVNSPTIVWPNPPISPGKEFLDVIKHYEEGNDWNTRERLIGGIEKKEKTKVTFESKATGDLMRKEQALVYGLPVPYPVSDAEGSDFDGYGGDNGAEGSGGGNYDDSDNGGGPFRMQGQGYAATPLGRYGMDAGMPATNQQSLLEGWLVENDMNIVVEKKKKKRKKLLLTRLPGASPKERSPARWEKEEKRRWKKK
ncbi:hypothetical protein BPAE_0911g00020 [Botrytis paeoniae]|uniref:Uncharacterized protein n=1 Tax=Botrytis paeoniae TaxID=278948 RepID=A0A4Z1ELQ3_9HELO|nr:hypothetical protein BPAE_0911g00020 [Botrytis paeoniae]